VTTDAKEKTDPLASEAARRFVEAADRLHETRMFVDAMFDRGPNDTAPLGATVALFNDEIAMETFECHAGACILALREMARVVLPGGPRPEQDAPETPPPDDGQPDVETAEGINYVVRRLDMAGCQATPELLWALRPGHRVVALAWAEAVLRAFDCELPGMEPPPKPDFLP
jgi:hypothetical protein